MLVKVSSNGEQMSNTRYHQNGKPTWWLRTGSTFIQINKVRGDQAFEQELDLEPGEYHLGCGPRDRHGVRQSFKVSAKKSKKEQTDVQKVD